MKHYGDITQLSGYNLPVVDVITGGSPCQDLSVAGARKGLSGERSGLFIEQIRIVKEMRERDVRSGRSGHLVRPRYLIWENVPGAFSSNNGEDFRIVLEEICKVAEGSASVPRPEKKWSSSGAIMGDGWSVAWRVHDAQFWGVPQRRKRISLVADFGGFSAPEILFERKGLSRDIEPSAEERKGSSERVEGISGESGFYDAFQHHGWRKSDISGPITVGNNNNVRGDTPLVSKEIMPALVASMFKGPGNTSENVSPPLLSDSHGTPHAVCIPEPTMIEMTSTKNTIIENGISTTLTARMETGGNQVNAVSVGNGQLNNMSMTEAANSLDCMHDQQAVLVTAVDFQSRVGNVVRRLMPLECERLQGMPDDWSRYGINEKGEVYELPDSARYRLQGNGIATPFWRYLLKRISAQYERAPTLGSLFDGQASFPMLWESINGSGTALWSSEIEKHAIAVAKYHFPEDAET